MEGFKNDSLYQAMEEFDQKVSEMIHNIVQQMVFSHIFRSTSMNYKSVWRHPFSTGGDGSIVDDIIWFSKVYSRGGGCLFGSDEGGSGGAEEAGL